MSASTFRNSRYRQTQGVATPAGGIATYTSPEAARASAPARLPIGPLLPVVGGNLAAPLAGDGTPGTTGRTARAVNLDYAASAPALQAVADHVAEVLPYYASVHRGAGYASQVSTALYESARQTVGAFVGARPGDLTIFTRNTTDALNLLAASVPQDGPGAGEVIVLDVEHHANLLPWTSGAHRLIPTAATVAETVAALEAALAERPAALVAVTGCSNVTGEILPVAEIARIAHAHGARIVVDGAQLVPHRRVDIAALDIDYLAFSGHKLYAPFGSGVLIGRSDWLDVAPPHQLGGGAVRAVNAEGRATWTTGWRGTRAVPPTCSARRPWPRPAGRSPSCPKVRSRSTKRLCPSGFSRVWSRSRRCACCARGRTAPSGSAWSASRSRVTRPPGSPCTCRPSTVSVCATASSARTRCSTGWASRVARCAPASAWARAAKTPSAWCTPCAPWSPRARSSATSRSTVPGPR